jgi:hypothetical protein
MLVGGQEGGWTWKIQRSPFAIFQMHLKIKLPHYTFIFSDCANSEGKLLLTFTCQV